LSLLLLLARCRSSVSAAAADVCRWCGSATYHWCASVVSMVRTHARVFSPTTSNHARPSDSASATTVAATSVSADASVDTRWYRWWWYRWWYAHARDACPNAHTLHTRNAQPRTRSPPESHVTPSNCAAGPGRPPASPPPPARRQAAPRRGRQCAAPDDTTAARESSFGAHGDLNSVDLAAD